MDTGVCRHGGMLTWGYVDIGVYIDMGYVNLGVCGHWG